MRRAFMKSDKFSRRSKEYIAKGVIEACKFCKKQDCNGECWYYCDNAKCEIRKDKFIKNLARAIVFSASESANAKKIVKYYYGQINASTEEDKIDSQEWLDEDNKYFRWLCYIGGLDYRCHVFK